MSQARKRTCEECRSFLKSEKADGIGCEVAGFWSIAEVRTIFPGFPDVTCRFFRPREEKVPPHKPKFPHMKALECEIFASFLELHPEFKNCDFDVRVGLPKDSRYAKLTQRRVDVISYVGKEAWILKVVSKLRPTALGELKVWSALYKSTRADVDKVRLGVVCQFDDSELRPIFEREGIKVFLVQRDISRNLMLMNCVWRVGKITRRDNALKKSIKS